MKYVTITANSYEEALRKAEEEYGKNIRVHSRRDYTVGGGLFTRKRGKCDLTLYIPQTDVRKEKGRDDEAMLEFEKEARTPDPSSLSREERLNTEVYRGSLEKLTKAEKILNENDISEPLYTFLLKDFSLEQKVEGEDALLLSFQSLEENLAHLTLKPVLWNYSSSFGILYKKEPKSKVASFISVLKESGKM